MGGQLFDRINNQLVLTDAGRYLLRKAETVLAEMDEAEAGLAEFRLGRRRRISVGALASIARTIVADAYREAVELVPELELDLHELAPAEAVEQLYGRNLQIALLSSISIAANRISFTRVDLARDPYVFAVPRGLDLANVTDPERDLPPDQRRVLNRSIQFNFGNLHNQRVDEWYRSVLPRHQVAAWCRTYELALAMVQAGLGVALVPQLCTRLGGQAAYDVSSVRGAGHGTPDRRADPAPVPPHAAVRDVRAVLAAVGRRPGPALGRPDPDVHRGWTGPNGSRGRKAASGLIRSRPLAGTRA